MTKVDIRNWNALWFLLYAIGLGICLIGLPKHWDDLWFMDHLQDWFKVQGLLYPDGWGDVFHYGIPWEGIIEIWKDHAAMDNIRLGNMMSPLLLLFPKWFGSGVMVVCFLVSLYMLGRLIHLDLRKSPLVALGIVLVSFWMPWREFMGSLVYQINYLGSTFLSMCLVWIILRRHKGTGIWRCVGVVALGVIVGWWHEGFGFPLGFGFAVTGFCFRRFRRGNVWGAICGLAAGVLISLSCEGMHGRMKYHGGFPLGWFSGFIVEHVYVPAVIMIAGIMLEVWKRGWKRVESEPVWVFCVASGLASLALMHYSSGFDRGGWWFRLMTVAILIHSLQHSYPQFWEKYSWRNGLILAPLLLLVYAQLGLGGYYTLLVRKKAYDDFQVWLREPGKTRFTEVATLRDVPLICGYYPLGIGVTRIWDGTGTWLGGNITSAYSLSRKTYDEGNGGIPETLRYVTAESGDAIAGYSAVRIKDGYLFIPEDEQITRRLKRENTSCLYDWMDIDFGKGYVPVKVCRLSFISEADGRRYSYIHLNLSWYMTHFKSIKGVRKQKN